MIYYTINWHWLWFKINMLCSERRISTQDILSCCVLPSGGSCWHTAKLRPPTETHLLIYCLMCNCSSSIKLWFERESVVCSVYVQNSIFNAEKTKNERKVGLPEKEKRICVDLFNLLYYQALFTDKMFWSMRLLLDRQQTKPIYSCSFKQ